MSPAERYEYLVRQYSEALYWHIRRIVVCHDDAQDILQDTLSSAFLHLWQLRDTTKARNWLYRIATNKSYLFLKKKARELKCEDINDHLAEMLTDDVHVNFEKAAAIDLHKALLKLPRTQQLVFSLRFFDEMDYEQISNVTGISIDSIRVSYHFAKKKVTQYINEEQL